jgi:hypothetical protein
MGEVVVSRCFVECNLSRRRLAFNTELAPLPLPFIGAAGRAPRMATNGYRTFWGMLWRLALAGALVFAMGAAAAYAAVVRLVRTPEVEAPSLVTLPVEDALRDASRAGFSLRVSGEEPSTVLPAGRVLSQRPAPGEGVKAGAVIHVRVSRTP